MAWPRRGRRYQRWWGYPPQYPYAYPPQQYPYPPYAYPPPMYPPIAPVPQSPEDELAALEDYRKELEDEKASIEQELDVEARIKELKALLGRGKGQPPGP